MTIFNSMFNLLTVVEERNVVTITGFPVIQFLKDSKKQWETSKATNIYRMAYSYGFRNTISMKSFFLPDFIYMLSSLPKRKIYQNIINLIYKETWMKSTKQEVTPIVDMSLISKEMNVTLKPYQEDFIKIYDELKQKYRLNGYLLAFQTGMGKTLSALALMTALNKDKIVVVAPNNTIYDTWYDEINKFFKNKQVIWTKEKPNDNAKFFLINFESLEKLLYLKELSSGNIGIIVDEIHYFRYSDANRTKNILALKAYTKTKDVLPMSGTPPSHMGKEMIPMLQLLDPYFTDSVQEIFKKTFGVSSLALADILKNRLGLVMHKKTKQEVGLNLPELTEEDILVKVPNGNEFELETVKKKIKTFVEDRTKYYTDSYKQYEEIYLKAISIYTSSPQFNSVLFNSYQTTVNKIKNKKYSSFQDRIDSMKSANKIEKENITPTLPNGLRQEFKKAKSVYKYVNMVILGEVIGHLLTKLRADMYSQMFKYSPVRSIIENSVKKTLLFTTYVDVVDTANEIVTNEWKMKPILVYGKTKDLNQALKDFKSMEELNPLIATIQTLATGVTLVEANTVIFLAKPFRFPNYMQAYSRIYRIGQTEPCYVYSLVLDTGGTQNLSTRLEEIVAWSKEIFDAVVGLQSDNDIPDDVVALENIHDDLIIKYITTDIATQIANGSDDRLPVSIYDLLKNKK